MYCRNCGAEMNENAAICVKCGVAKGTGNSYCRTAERRQILELWSV